MEKRDILFKTKNGLFGYRTAGILIREGRILLQHLLNDPIYAFPGGHVNMGEVSKDALVREFKEEAAIDICPVRLLWVGENYFHWGADYCHQICLYYLVTVTAETQIPPGRNFLQQDVLDGKNPEVEFCWMELSTLADILVYPIHAKQKLLNLSDEIETFVYIED